MSDTGLAVKIEEICAAKLETVMATVAAVQATPLSDHSATLAKSAETLREVHSILAPLVEGLRSLKCKTSGGSPQ